MLIIFSNSDAMRGVGIGVTILSGIIALFMGISIIITYSCINADVEGYKKKYEALSYKAQTEAIRDEFGIVNKEYIDEIEEWNVDLAKRKAKQRDFWIGIFTPNVYDQFEFIDLDSIKIKDVK